MKTQFKLISSILFVTLLNFSGKAWGDKGHQLVAELTKSLLKQKVIDSVQHYFHEMTFEKAAVWMDEIKTNKKYEYLKPLHYINIEKDKTYAKVTEPNIMNELDLVIGQLKSNKFKSADDKKLALLILFHLLGDIHQPLHAGYGSDKGGNSVSVNYHGAHTNLHKVWDINLIEDQKIDLQSCKMAMEAIPKKDKKSIQEINTVNWLNDSRGMLTEVYNYKDGAIDEAYSQKNKVLIEKQIAKAALRLAAVLSEIF